MATTQRTRSKPRRTRRVIPLGREGEQAIRWSKVMSAQERLASGHYDRDDVRSRLVEEVLRELRRD